MAGGLLLMFKFVTPEFIPELATPELLGVVSLLILPLAMAIVHLWRPEGHQPRRSQSDPNHIAHHAAVIDYPALSDAQLERAVAKRATAADGQDDDLLADLIASEPELFASSPTAPMRGPSASP